MYCSKCGSQIPEGQSACPNCAANEAPHVQATPVEPAPAKAPAAKGPSKSAKGYAAIVSALMVFPATICTMVNLIRGDETFWAGYVLGALAVVWVCTVLPFLKITPPAVTGIICFATISCYLLYIVKQSGHMQWFYSYAMPMCLLICIFAAVNVSLVGAGKVRGAHTASLILGETTVFFIVCEIMRDNYKRGVIDLRWSLILACCLVSLIAIFEAIGYIAKLSKK